MTIGDKIKARRIALGMSLEQVGERVGVGKSTVRKWEIGMIKNMRGDKIQRLASVLEMDPTDFIVVDSEEEASARLTIEALKLFRDGDLTDPVFRSALLEAFLVSATFYPSAPQEASIPGDGPCVRLLLNLPTEKSTTEDGGASEPGESSYKEIWWTSFSLIRTLRFSQGRIILFCTLQRKTA